MIQPAAPTLAPSAPTAPSPASAGGGSGAFALSLARFVDTIEADGEAIAPPGEDTERHDAADGGNALPGDANKDAPAIDPALAWLSLPVPTTPDARPIAFVPPPVAVSTTVGGRPDTVKAAAALLALPDLLAVGDSVSPKPATPGDAEAAGPAAGNDSPASLVATLLRRLPATVLPAHAAAPQREQSIPDARSSAATPALAAILPDQANSPAQADLSPVLPIALARNTPISPSAGGTSDLPARTSPIAPSVDPIAPPPPAQVIAAAVAGASRPVAAQDEPTVATRRADELASQPTTIAPLDNKPVAVPATGNAQTPTLDLRQERWTHGIIDHIERLRDGIDAADTRIRLVPDALGSIDVSVRKDGDTLHVHFAAEQAATRTILHDAQPKLAEIAEQRGLKLGQTGVSGGNDGDRRSPQPQSQPQPSHLPRPAPIAARVTQSTDERLA